MPKSEILSNTQRHLTWHNLETLRLQTTAPHLTTRLTTKAAIKSDYDQILGVAPEFAKFSLGEFSWARMIACSRNFGIVVNGLRTSALVPFADMLNHLRPRETKWTFDSVSQCFTITALAPIQPGAQVYDSYGKKCNHRFLLNYGFSLENNIEEDGSCPNEIAWIFEVDAARRCPRASLFVHQPAL